MKKCKVLMAFLSLSCVLALKIPIQVNAKVDSNQNGEISVQYLQLESVLPSLSITNGTATCKGTVRSKNGTKCSATITLQKKIKWQLGECDFMDRFRNRELYCQGLQNSFKRY